VPRYRPSLPSLLRRSLVLLGLILEAALLYLRAVLVGRGWLRTSPERLNAGYTRFARRFVAVATRYRAGLIKLGQLASLRFDVLPEEISQELARLQDRVPPHDYGEIATQIEHELGRPPEACFRACFRRFERQPVAAASLGQVHVAWNERGEKLAVKILYPGIERSVAVDLRMTRLALWLFDFVSVADLGQVYRQISDSIHGEMDYLREGRAAEEVAENLARDPALFARLRIPKIHWETTTRRVLTMEFVEGQKIVDTLASAERAKEREEAVQVAASSTATPTPATCSSTTRAGSGSSTSG
jgi:predicted unusual protein kinase regulating ubiquinone biosynthesis (AarF/ABC1/UbiB family)